MIVPIPATIVESIQRRADQLLAQRKKSGKRRVWASDHDFVGGMGEAAFCIATGMQISTTRSLTGDGGIDVKYRGFTYDIKATEVMRGRLMVAVADLPKLRADRLVLAAVSRTASEVHLLGWIETWEFIRSATRQTIKVPTAVWTRPLKPIDEALREVKMQPTPEDSLSFEDQIRGLL